MRQEARIRFGHAEFEVIERGDFVRCAATGVAIAISELRYWDVALQLAFSSPEAAFGKISANTQS